MGEKKNETLAEKIRDVFEEGFFSGPPGDETLAQAWGDSEAREYAAGLVPLPADLFRGGAITRFGDLVLLRSEQKITMAERDRLVTRLSNFGDAVGVHFALLSGFKVDAVLSDLRERLAKIVNESEGSAEIVDRVLALLAGQRTNTSDAGGG